MTSALSTVPVLRARRRWHQYSLRTLLVVMLLVAAAMSWAAAEIRKVDERRRVEESQLTMAIYTCSDRSFPWYSGWLHKLFGQEESYDYESLVLNNFASVNDDTLAAIAHFENLGQLWLNGEISITDAGLEKLAELKQLRDLSLADAPVTAAAVERLRRSLPDCKITWQTPRFSEPADADEPPAGSWTVVGSAAAAI